MRRSLAPLVGLMAVFATACGGEDTAQDKQAAEVERGAQALQPYLPKNNVEFENYNKAQQLYDDPSTIIWCTVFPSSPSAPIVTIPVTGKLTSSSTTYFQPERVDDLGAETGGVVVPARSVDKLFHPNPPQYRYGFTPGGQYVDFFNMETTCTTKPMKFERQEVIVDTDAALSAADTKAEEALKAGDNEAAQAALEDAAP